MTILTESQMAHFSGAKDLSADRTALLPRDGRAYVRGTETPELKYITIPQMMRETVSRFGPHEALVMAQTGERLSYYDLDREVDRLASGLLALGLQKGDRLGIWAPNCKEWVLTQFATARVGIVLVTINPAYRLSELEYALNKVGCKAIILAETFKKSNYAEMIRTLAPELENCDAGRLNSVKLPQLKHVVVMSDAPGNGAWSFEQLMNLGGPAHQLRLDDITASLNPDDAINIQFTSGTTGAPKGATLSHYNIANNARFTVDRMNFTEADRLCIPVPLYHCFGMVLGTLGCVSVGATMVMPGEGFDPVSTLDACAKERCSALYGVPTMFVAMLEELKTTSRDLSKLRTGIMAGAPCPIEVMRSVMDKMNMKEVTIGYGMTETSPISWQSFTDEPIEKRVSTVGRVHPHVEVKVMGKDGETLAPGVQGELCTRGYNVMTGYWGDEEKTQESIVDGWMLTGDLGVIDAEGYASITGRVKDMIIRGGENIYPREIEEYLFRHPKVSEVQVFGIPDEKFGEEVCAWAVPTPGESLTEDELRAFCQGQIAHFKIPRHFRVVDALPMTITGKPQKFVMRDQMISHLANRA